MSPGVAAALSAEVPVATKGLIFLHRHWFDPETKAPLRMRVFCIRKGAVYIGSLGARRSSEYCTLERWPHVAALCPDQTLPPQAAPVLTPQKVGAMLKKAGFQRNRSWASGRVKGWRNNSGGFQVQKRFDGAIIVRHRSDTRSDESIARRLGEYAALLKPLGAVLQEFEVVIAAPGQPPPSCPA